MEEMLSFHQVIVKGLDKSLAYVDIASELNSLYRFFANYGKIVDFNLEYYPNMIYITYSLPTSVKNLTTLANVEYFMINQTTIKFSVIKNETAIYVRNLKNNKISNYENFFPKNKIINVAKNVNNLNNNQISNIAALNNCSSNSANIGSTVCNPFSEYYFNKKYVDSAMNNSYLHLIGKDLIDSLGGKGYILNNDEINNRNELAKSNNITEKNNRNYVEDNYFTNNNVDNNGNGGNTSNLKKTETSYFQK